MTVPQNGPRVSPAGPIPVATQSPGRPGTGPSTGNPSVLTGRRPTRASSHRALDSAGTSDIPFDSTCATPPPVSSGANPAPSSRVAPITTRSPGKLSR